MEPAQVGAEPRQLRDLAFHGREVLPDERQHVLARSGALVPDREDTSDVGKRDPKCLRPADEAQPLHCLFTVQSVASRRSHAGTDKANPVIVPEGLGLDGREGAEASDSQRGMSPLGLIASNRSEGLAEVAGIRHLTKHEGILHGEEEAPRMLSGPCVARFR